MRNVIVAVLVAVLVLVLAAPAVLAKPDMNKPLPATDVLLVKKATPHGKPGGGGGGKPVKQAATGTLGDQLGAGANKYAVIKAFPIIRARQMTCNIAMTMQRTCILP